MSPKIQLIALTIYSYNNTDIHMVMPNDPFETHGDAAELEGAQFQNLGPCKRSVFWILAMSNYLRDINPKTPVLTRKNMAPKNRKKHKPAVAHRIARK
jgi:hypothetical protein